MPSAKILEEKKAVVAELAERMQNSVAGVFVDYKGINVANDTKLRSELRKNNVKYTVVKNTLTRFAAEQIGFQELDPILNGTTALAVSEDDPVISAKILCDYAKKSGGAFKIKAGFVEGKVISAEQVKALADLPPREILIAQVLGGLNAPVTSLVSVLNANIRGLAVVLNKIAEQKSA